MLTPRSFTCLLDGIKNPLILRHSLLTSFWPKNIIRNFEGLAFMPLSVDDHFVAPYIL